MCLEKKARYTCNHEASAGEAVIFHCKEAFSTSKPPHLRGPCKNRPREYQAVDACCSNHPCCAEAMAQGIRDRDTLIVRANGDWAVAAAERGCLNSPEAAALYTFRFQTANTAFRSFEDHHLRCANRRQAHNLQWAELRKTKQWLP